MDTILLTGSNGLLGQKIAGLLSNRGVQLVATSRNESRAQAKGKNCIFETLDITNKPAIEYICSKYKPGVIINAAALTNVNECELARDNCMDVNATGVENLVEAANKVNAHLVHVSTDFIFDGTKSPYSEGDIPNPVNFYGMSKLDGERRVIKKARKYSIIRTILVYGVVEFIPRLNFVLWVKQSLEKNIPIRVTNDQFRMPTLADDLAEACINIASKREGGVFHVSGNEMMSILEIAYRVAGFFNLNRELILPVTSAGLNEVAKRPHKTSFILDKIKRSINYSPHSFIEGLQIVSDQLRLYGINTP